MSKTVAKRIGKSLSDELARGRPVPDAAAAVEATALKAKEMLEQIQASWLWALITTKKE